LGGRIHCSCEQPERDEVTNGLRGLEHSGDDAERREYRQAGEPLDPAAQDARYLRDLLTKVAKVRRRLARKLKETAVVAPRQPEPRNADAGDLRAAHPYMLHDTPSRRLAERPRSSDRPCAIGSSLP
jgi:hypothetical protein